MTASAQYLLAALVAEAAHEGQQRRGGEAFIQHPRRVSVSAQLDALNDRPDLADDAAVVGLLHDVVEDTKVTAKMLRLLFPKRIVEAVLAVTRRPGESYEKFVDRTLRSGSTTALYVKRADLRDNLADDARDPEKYERALRRINEALEADLLIAEAA